MRLSPSVLTALILAAPLAAQAPHEFVEQGGRLFRVELGELYPVDAGVVSLRFADPPADAQAALDAAWQSAGGRDALTVVRSNRLGIVDVALPAGADPRSVVAALDATGRFEFVETSAFGRYGGIPNDPSFGTQWNLHNVGQSGGTVGADVNAATAWDIEDGDPSVVIAVLDSGGDWTHPDLAAAFWANVDETVNGVDDDGNGFVDDVRGWDFGSGDNNPMGAFDHGTWVSGCVAAVSNNGTGIAGLAGGASDGQGCRIMNLNVGSFSPVASILDDAILYAVDNGARVITMSLQVPSDSATMSALAAAEAAGVFIDCASGNNGIGVTFPANQPQVMAVASTNRFDGKSGFSNSGPEVEVAAPGEDILMTALGGGYSTSSGTSFAAPHVAALAGLLFSADPSLTASAVRQILRDSAHDVSTPGFDNGTGWGRIDAEAALGMLGSVGQVIVYGAGLGGTGGQLPVIATRGGVPNLGDLDFGVTLADALPSAQAILILGVVSTATPFKGGTLLVDVSRGRVLVPVTTTPLGTTQVLLPIPNDPLLVDASLFTQWVVSDPGAPLGFALSAGLELVVGS